MDSHTVGELPRTSPSEAGVDAQGIIDYVTLQENTPGQQLHSLQVLKGGALIAEAYWEPYQPCDATLVYSMSKTFTSAVVGIAESRGLLSYDDRIVECLPELEGLNIGPKARSIRLRDCLGMATGYVQSQVDAFCEPVRANPYTNLTPRKALGDMLSREPEGIVGKTFCYNNLATYACSVIAGRALGHSVWEELQQSVFGYIGVDSTWWSTDAEGNSVGMSELRISAPDAARFFRMAMAGGRVDDRQLLAPEWLAQYWRVHTRHDDNPGDDWANGYGWQVWTSKYGHRADGAYGQYALMMPKYDALVVITGAEENTQFTLDGVWDHIVPALERGGSVEADERWLELARGLRLTGPELFEGGPASGKTSDGKWALEASPAGPEFAVSLTDPRGATHQFTCGPDEWLPVELSWNDWKLQARTRAGWDGGIFEVDLVLPETPHRLRLRCERDGLQLIWVAGEPLGSNDLAGLARSPQHTFAGMP